MLIYLSLAHWHSFLKISSKSVNFSGHFAHESNNLLGRYHTDAPLPDSEVKIRSQRKERNAPLPDSEFTVRRRSEECITGSLHQCHESFSTNDLDAAVQRAAVLDGLTGCHHHASTNRVNWVRNQTRRDCHHYKYTQTCRHLVTTYHRHIHISTASVQLMTQQHSKDKSILIISR